MEHRVEAPESYATSPNKEGTITNRDLLLVSPRDETQNRVLSDFESRLYFPSVEPSVVELHTVMYYIPDNCLLQKES